jgi:tetratricopeptide (TPR) repeat protein
LAEYRQAYLLSPGYGPHARDVADWIWALGGDAEESRKLYLKAIDLDPANSYSHLTMAYWLYANGQLPAAEVELGKVRDLDPSQDIHGLVSLVLLAGGKPQQALIESKLQSSEVDRLAAAALIFPALGKSAEADAALLELTRRFAATNACDIARAHANRGEPDKAFEWLDRAFAKRDICLIYPAINRDPLYEKLRADPRYLAFLGKMHLPN